MLNASIYDVIFLDGSIQLYSANTIIYNIYSRVDEEGHRYMLLDDIIDHSKNETAIEKVNGYMIDSNDIQRRKMTTRGRLFLVNWKDGFQS